MGDEFNKTLFVRNLPYNATNETLENIFSDVGPLKSSFVVKEKETGKCKGYGYVKFSLREDAESAKNDIQTVEGRKIFIEFANKKPKRKKRKLSASDDDLEEIKDSGDEENEAKEEKVAKKPVAVKVNKNAAKDNRQTACTVVVKNFKPKLYEKHVKPVLIGQQNQQKVVYPVPDRENNVATILFNSKIDALKASRNLNNLKIRGQLIAAQLLSIEIAVSQLPQSTRKCRLIIRNISFKCTEKVLKDAFKKYGQVTEISIPKKSDGKLIGFCFVQFATMKEASKAIEGMNMKPILGRPVAVDWAVSKDRFQKSSKVDDKDSANEEDDQISEKSGSSDDEEDMEGTESSAAQDESKSSEDEDEGASADSEEAVSDGSDSDASNDDESDDDKVENVTAKSPRKSDVDEGKTLFIRNLSYDTEEEDLGEFFEQFGKLNYCRIVIDPNTEHSRGTAFVQFKTKEEAGKALAEAELKDKEGTGLVLDGRKLFVTPAVTKERAKKITEMTKDKEGKDSRNLYLAREGMIRPGTQAAEGLPTIDLNKRMKIDSTKRQKLKNPEIFISPLRLCVHNIPVIVDDRELKRKFLLAVKDRSAWITECRIMRDLARVNKEGVGKSRGYGFISFKEHRHALSALKATNNNPEIFGENKRLIVEFSLENRAALAKKAMRLERAKAKEEIRKKGKTTFVDVKIRKKKKEDQQRSVSTGAVDEDQEEEMKKMKKGPKGLPSHWGPKIRHKNRNKHVDAPKKAQIRSKLAEARQDKIKRKAENEDHRPKAKKRSRRGNVQDHLDQLVNKYRKTFSAAVTTAKRSKWFDSS